MLDNLVLAIAPVGVRCNLACSYCYHRNSREAAGRERLYIERSDVAKLWIQAKDQASQVVNLWHGGEPLLLGTASFERMLASHREIMGKHPSANIVQTNGTLIKPSWTGIFRHYGVSVGVSLDGPEFLHDGARTAQHSRGSWKNAISGYRILHEAGLKPGIAVTMRAGRDQNLRARAVFTFLSGQKPERVGIQPATDDSGPTSHAAIRFFTRFLDLWRQAGQPFMLKPIEDIQRLGAGLPSLSCHWGPRRCHKFLSVGPKGLAYPCMRLHGRHEWLLGDIRQTSLPDLMASPAYQKLLNPPEDCLGCEVFDICRGGCPAERWLLTGRTDVKHPLCSFYLRLIRLVLDGS